MSDTGVQARRSAVYLLDMILEEESLMSELLASGALDKLPPDDRARAQRLALDTLRGMERADRLLQKHLSKYPPLTVRNALRVGTVELCQGGAAHGVVNAMVELVGSHKKLGHLKGLTNAVLRKIATEGPEAWDALRSPRLPKWLRGPLTEAWGAEAIAGIEAAHFAGAPLDLTAKKDPEALAEAVGGVVLPTGSVRVMDAGQVTAMPGFAEGDWWVQDAAAALPVKILAPQKGEAVLDLCAAPGGKTMQLAAAGAQVTAVDSSKPRMQRVRENLARVHLPAKVVVVDARKFEGQFDAILLDAPCSATGVIRRHPDIKLTRQPDDIAALAVLQGELLDALWPTLEVGGILLYATCSTLPTENTEVIQAFLARTSGARELDLATTAGIKQPHGRQLLAQEGGHDGFYYAKLIKIAAARG